MSSSKSDRIPSLCIFANFSIDNEERLQRMKDSFFSFCNVMPEEWRINIRGRFKNEACDFLHEKLGDELSIFCLESSKGWFYDSYSFMSNVESDYIFFWIEDHICLVRPEVIRNLIIEIDEFGAHQLWYSFFYKTLEVFDNFPVILEGVLTRVVQVDEIFVKQMLNRNLIDSNLYVVSAISIMRKDFFISVLSSRKPFLKRWPKYLPHDFEKKFKDRIAPVIVTAVPKQELFASIDDDHGYPNSSLIARGLYPNRISRNKIKELEYGHRGSIFDSFYSLFPDLLRRVLISFYIFLRRFFYTISSFMW